MWRRTASEQKAVLKVLNGPRWTRDVPQKRPPNTLLRRHLPQLFEGKAASSVHINVLNETLMLRDHLH